MNTEICIDNPSVTDDAQKARQGMFMSADGKSLLFQFALGNVQGVSVCFIVLLVFFELLAHYALCGRLLSRAAPVAANTWRHQSL